MAKYFFSRATTQHAAGHSNYALALKIDVTGDPALGEVFTILDETRADAAGSFVLQWGSDFGGEDWSGRVAVGVVDDEQTEPLQCSFNDWQAGAEPGFNVFSVADTPDLPVFGHSLYSTGGAGVVGDDYLMFSAPSTWGFLGVRALWVDDVTTVGAVTTQNFLDGDSVEEDAYWDSFAAPFPLQPLAGLRILSPSQVPHNDEFAVRQTDNNPAWNQDANAPVPRIEGAYQLVANDRRDAPAQAIVANAYRFNLAIVCHGDNANLDVFGSYVLVGDKAAFTSNLMGLNKTDIAQFYFGYNGLLEADHPLVGLGNEGAELYRADHLPDWSQGSGGFWGIRRLTVFGSIVYVTHLAGKGAPYKTDGWAHLDQLFGVDPDVQQSYAWHTSRFLLSGNNLSFLDKRIGVVHCDRADVDDTLGVEVEGGTCRIIDSATGATLSSFAVDQQVFDIACDWVDGHIYVLSGDYGGTYWEGPDDEPPNMYDPQDGNETVSIKKYDMAGTLLGTISRPYAVGPPYATAKDLWVTKYGVVSSRFSCAKNMATHGEGITIDYARPDQETAIFGRLVYRVGY